MIRVDPERTHGHMWPRDAANLERMAGGWGSVGAGGAGECSERGTRLDMSWTQGLPAAGKTP